MKLVQCPNKHYYDADKFKECPICHPAMANRVDLDRQEDQGEDKTVALSQNEIPEAVKNLDQPTPKDDDVHFDPMTGKPLHEVEDDGVHFDPMTGKPLHQSHDDEVRFDPMTGKPLQKETTDDEVRFDPMTGKPLSKMPEAHEDDDEVKFDPMTGERLVKKDAEEKVEEPDDEVRFDPMTGKRIQKPVMEDFQSETNIDDDVTEKIEPAEDVVEDKPMANETNLADIIAHASTTVSEDDAEDATIPFYASKDSFVKGRGYVVGWLVSVKGPAKGNSYNLYAGKNTIGRGNTSDVRIDNDRSIARNKHAIVIYDPKNNDYIAMPGESKELYYVNGDLVLTPTKLNARDRLSLGESELMLVPLCDDTFNWDNENDQ